jgi:hypothetical protein
VSRFRLMTLLPEMGFDVFVNPSLIHRSKPHIGCRVVPDNSDIQVAGWLSSSLRLSVSALLNKSNSSFILSHNTPDIDTYDLHLTPPQ